VCCGGLLSSFYSLDRLVPGEVCMETPRTTFRRIRSIFPPRLRRPGTRPGSADPWVGPPNTAFGCEIGKWTIGLILKVSHKVTTVCSAKLALLSLCNAGCDLLCILLHSLVFSPCIFSRVPAYHNSPKLVKMVRVKSLF
jgi:hypothetical protein